MVVNTFVKGKMVKNKRYLALELSDIAFIFLIVLKCHDILTFMSRIKFMLRLVENEMSFISTGLVLNSYEMLTQGGVNM